MPDHSTHFENTHGGMILTNAILLYRNQGSRTLHAYGASGPDAGAFASIHKVEHTREEHPTIAAGVPLTRAHLRQWTELLGRSVAPELLPGNMLVAHADMLAWWVPSKVRPAWFALSSPPDGLRVLHERTIVPVPYPAHLFVATRSGLGVYALPSMNARWPRHDYCTRPSSMFSSVGSYAGAISPGPDRLASHRSRTMNMPCSKAGRPIPMSARNTPSPARAGSSGSGTISPRVVRSVSRSAVSNPSVSQGADTPHKGHATTRQTLSLSGP